MYSDNILLLHIYIYNFYLDEIFAQTQHLMEDVDESMEDVDESMDDMSEELRQKVLTLLSNLYRNDLEREQELEQIYYPSIEEENLERRLMEEYDYR